MKLKKALLTVLLIISIFTNMGINYSTKANAIFVPTQKILVTPINFSNNSVLEVQNASIVVDFNLAIEMGNITYYWAGGKVEILTKVKSVTIECFLDGNKKDTKTDNIGTLSRTYTYKTSHLSEGNHSMEVIVNAQLYIPLEPKDYRSYFGYGSSEKILFTIEKPSTGVTPEQSANPFSLTDGAYSSIIIIALVAVIVTVASVYWFTLREKKE